MFKSFKMTDMGLAIDEKRIVLGTLKKIAVWWIGAIHPSNRDLFETNIG
jgi:hypothetical protein